MRIHEKKLGKKIWQLSDNVTEMIVPEKESFKMNEKRHCLYE